MSRLSIEWNALFTIRKASIYVPQFTPFFSHGRLNILLDFFLLFLRKKKVHTTKT